MEYEEKYCYTAVVHTFDRMVYLLGCQSRIDVIFHAGIIPHDKNELEQLCIQYKDNVTKYVYDSEDIYYFRFGVPDHYRPLRYGFPLSKLKEDVLSMMFPKPDPPRENVRKGWDKE